MKLGFFCFLAFLAIAYGSDAPCQNAGGMCQYDSNTCSGHYQSNMCSGSVSRRCCLPSGSGYNCYGDFMTLHPTGTKARKGSHGGLVRGGVVASEKMVTKDIKELNKRKDCYLEAGRKNCIHPAVIAGIASRETRGGAIIYRTKGWGDHHRAYGIMQCDGNASGLRKKCTKYNWDSCEHIDMMVRILLVPYVKRIRSKHPSWTAAQQLQGAVAAYNVGPDNVRTLSGMDIGTTGNDYSNDVMARAQYLVSNFGW